VALNSDYGILYFDEPSVYKESRVPIIANRASYLSIRKFSTFSS